jgi:hypothetical protein
VDFCSTLGNYRKESEPLRQGGILWGTCREGVLSYQRSWGEERVVTAVNSSETPQEVQIPWDGGEAVDLFTRRRYRPGNGVLRFFLPPQSGVLLEGREKKQTNLPQS